MKTQVEEIGKNRFRVSIEVPEGDVARYRDRTYRKLAKEVRVPGFRPGKAPKPVIDQRLGRDFVRGEVLREALPELYAEAVRDTELDVVAPPEIDVKHFEEGEDLVFEAVVETRPTAELKEYTGLEVTRPAAEVEQSEVDEQIEQLQLRFASLEVAERPIRSGDFALIDLTTYRHDETIEDLTAKDFLLEVGAEMVVAEVDAELEGKQRGDILKVAATLPERFGERAGWQVGMQILVKEVKARKLPELDDDFAKTVSEFDTLEQLRADLRERLEEAKRQQAEAALQERVVEAFVERGVEVDLPEGMIALEVDGQIDTMARVLSARGAGLEQYLEHENIDLDALRQRFREQAERNLVLRLGLEAVAEVEGIEVSEEDRDKQIEQLASRVGQDPEEVRQLISERGDWGSVDGDIIRTKALDFLVEQATIVTEEGSS